MERADEQPEQFAALSLAAVGVPGALECRELYRSAAHHELAGAYSGRAGADAAADYGAGGLRVCRDLCDRGVAIGDGGRSVASAAADRDGAVCVERADSGERTSAGL